MNRDEIIKALEIADALVQRYKYNKIQTYYTDSGVNARDNYPKQIELMKAGKSHRIRAFIGGNASGKSLWQSIESYFHFSGKYPKWWDGYRFKGPIQAWLCSKDAKSLRDGLQMILFGGIGEEDIGTGIIPREDLIDDKGHVQTWALSGTANCVGQMRVRHYDRNGQFDGWSVCGFKTYDQGWQSYQGPTLQWIGFDEEPDDGKIFAESIMRLRPKDGGEPGHFLATFTPTEGFRETYLAFVPDGVYPSNGLHPDDPSKFTQRVGWSDSPHLTEEWKTSTIANLKLTDPNNIEARTEGYASIGSGRIYPVQEDFIVVPQFQIPAYWPKAYGLDPSWTRTAALWGTLDPETKVIYIYSEYVQGQVVDVLHAEAIKARGAWIPGAIDPHGSKHRDNGITKFTNFQSFGLDIVDGDGEPLAMISRILGMLQSGQLKIFNTCPELIKEIRTYRWDPKNPHKIADKQKDDLCDALRYLISKIYEMAKSYNEFEEEQESYNSSAPESDEGRNPYTGY